MPRVCSVEGCINGPRRLVRGSGSVDPTVSFHVVPRDEPRRSQWLSALPMIKRQKDEPEKQMVCSLHFSASDYVYNPALGKSLGVPQRPVLSRAAVPSVSPSSNPLLVPLQQQAGGSVAIAESAIESDAAGAPVEIPSEVPCAHPEKLHFILTAGMKYVQKFSVCIIQVHESPDESLMSKNAKVLQHSVFTTEGICSVFQSDVAETERLQHDAATGPVGRHGEVLAAATGAAGLQTQKDSFQCPACGTTGRSVGHDKSVQVHVRGISVA
ncbi:uncharacterized protein LOC125944943 isoform X2 [Dermacentor silvarum]|uniref:uncharacterized protein LOC125944943 isoform X2 n=1 Tax=Dermacentor silvarum TaxID=543639 RepID=UPI0021018112|nr:uncharacterized protein LOC125944943 isoform X2 [Dermacentor silvarum]